MGSTVPGEVFHPAFEEMEVGIVVEDGIFHGQHAAALMGVGVDDVAGEGVGGSVGAEEGCAFVEEFEDFGAGCSKAYDEGVEGAGCGCGGGVGEDVGGREGGRVLLEFHDGEACGIDEVHAFGHEGVGDAGGVDVAIDVDVAFVGLEALVEGYGCGDVGFLVGGEAEEMDVGGALVEVAAEAVEAYGIPPVAVGEVEGDDASAVGDEGVDGDEFFETFVVIVGHAEEMAEGEAVVMFGALGGADEDDAIGAALLFGEGTMVVMDALGEVYGFIADVEEDVGFLVLLIGEVEQTAHSEEGDSAGAEDMDDEGGTDADGEEMDDGEDRHVEEIALGDFVDFDEFGFGDEHFHGSRDGTEEEGDGVALGAFPVEADDIEHDAAQEDGDGASHEVLHDPLARCMALEDEADEEDGSQKAQQAADGRHGMEKGGDDLTAE